MVFRCRHAAAVKLPPPLSAAIDAAALGVGEAIGARVEHAAEVVDAAAKRVEVDAVVVIVVVFVVVVVGGGGGGDDGDGGSRWGPRRRICRRVRRHRRDRHLLSSLGGADVHERDGPESTAGAPLPSPSMEVAPQRRGGWCCDEKLKTLLFSD